VAASKALPVLGVIISHAEGPISAADASNLLALKKLLGDRLIGEIPPLEPTEAPPSDAIDIDALTQRLLAAGNPTESSLR
jgi:hypothetical protein